MTTCHWIVDQHMIEHNEQDIVKALRASGVPITIGAYDRFNKPSVPSISEDDCAIVYGSLQFVDQYKKFPLIPGAYFQPKALEHTAYSNQIDPDLLLNQNNVLATFGDLVRRPDFYFNTFGASSIFVRPNSSLKIFSGCLMDRASAHQELSALNQLSSVTPETLVVVAPAQTILAEYRLMIVAREVVTGSRYQLNGAVSLSADIPDAVQQLAQTVAEHPWQPDVAYVCDIAQTPSGPRVLEFNAISTSGWYLADLPSLIAALNTAAQLEHAGDLSVGDIPPRPARRSTL